ncbi:peroxidase, family 2 domain-containing protein [Hirsutella rhossiliensis]|uniref:Peroxidase, family 2 domain-containing protein n=1 Tax=Hirsutella rhossiliensis TaxID=111463 RepID=A0A9P8N7J7_9HYPO|nr:peroxidase, family 2 domain-containing protein [Hirsutella rhossiliensis]KAH0968002.1 peroxidase, family 2 domain-containing protein [Hirsutella rhossiliensis]
MRLPNGSAITLTLLASSLQLVTASSQGQEVAAYPAGYKGYEAQAQPDYPEHPVNERRAGYESHKPHHPSKSHHRSKGGHSKSKDGPKLDVHDKRFKLFKKPGKGDARSACPGLNSLANHSFLPHNGKKLTATGIVNACFHGLGMSPETCSIITLSGLLAAKLSVNTVFDLPDVDRTSWGIEHDCSFSRKDAAEGDNVHFNKRNWDVALKVLKHCQENGKISARCLGKARAARVKDQMRINPTTNYDNKAAGHSAVEVARMILTMGDKHEGAELKYIRSIFEEERLPAHLGWKPKAYTCGVNDVLDLAVESQKPDPKILQHTSNGIVRDRLDILRTLRSGKKDFLQQVKKLVVKSGFRKPSVFESLVRLDKEVQQRFGKDVENTIDADPNH